ncbi:2'-5' RNA ligase family protein [Rhizobium sp. 1AS11]|uniref:2'-5' RNA ligase family protein n=1 Tax=Rhizobium acaciae TaxID=2989736 RepID=UPI002223D266|nr:2'-5' RNA ligase family protein [Rhizobium acaciae]MCW1410888.1 2'-5' RNA ligase family protein [Rhizobium acaciae]MCW1743260.1 2'-5' RNA ligase family protein [Rhizobium acaciae]
MIRTKVDPLWFKRCCAFHLQFFPDREALSKLCDLQESIERNSTAPLLRVPATSLHMTVATLLNAATQLRIPNHEVWKRKGERWKAIVEKLVEETPPIELHFDEVAASEAAIFVRAQEPVELRELRSAISDAICFEHWRPTPPQIAHMTLFRFSAVEWLPAVDFNAGFLPVGVRVGSLQLLEERVYPNVDVNMLSEPLLQGRSPR